MERRKRFALVIAALGLYLTIRGYHSRDGDQSYRLPLLYHRLDPSLYAHDPFVTALDVFQPHRGYLALLDVCSRPFGVSFALFALFSATFVVTCLGIDRLARSTWPGSGQRVGVVAVLLVLAAKAGNIGTNHLFESMLLDRLVALALGWTALAAMVSDPGRGKWVAAACIGLASVVHPSLGLQLGMLASSGWIVWGISGRLGVSRKDAFNSTLLIFAALTPSLLMMAGNGSLLFEGLSREDFLRISASIQSPQHMLPHLWRMPQWLAWFCYPLLAILSLSRTRFEPARARLMVLLLLILAGLGLAWVAIEPLGSLFATSFQPFRMATVARGICLVFLADRVLHLWSRGDATGMIRATVLVAGLSGDWLMVIVTLSEITASVAERFQPRCETFALFAALLTGTFFLTRHDTEAGHFRLLAAIIFGLIAWLYRLRGRPIEWNQRRRIAAGVGVWIVPLAAMIWPCISSRPSPLTSNWRFGEFPDDDVERLAVWCRDHTPADARFITPPGPKTFRLWSRREVAFNRASSPYHAAGLADWTTRFQDHVGFRGTIAEFARAYLDDRQALERRYQEMSDRDRARLAVRQGAAFVVSAAPSHVDLIGKLTPLHVEGRYAVYRVEEESLTRR